MAKEHPILFSPPMVKAILKGIKTMTRRLPGIRNTLVDGVHVSQKGWNSYLFNFNTAYIDNGPLPAGDPGPYLKVPSKIYDTVHRLYPLYQPGDWLWVRETFAYICIKEYCCANINCIDENPEIGYEYFADSGAAAPADWGDVNKEERPDWATWKPSIHMPKEAARIWLEVIRCFPQRIQQTTDDDAISEGIEIFVKKDLWNPKHQFNLLWNDVHPGSWINNDWVWVTEFKVLSTSGKPLFKI